MAFTPVATTDTLETFRTRYNATPLTIVDDSSTTVDITLATDSLKLSGGTGIASAISGDVVTFNLSNTGVSAASYGSSTAIPVLAINAQGQVTSASTASISTDLTLVDDASTAATISLATDTLKISGGTGTTSAISGDTVTINLDNTAVSAGSFGSSTAIPVLAIDAQGRITGASTASVSTDLTIIDDSSTSATISLGSDTLKFAGGAGVTTSISGDVVTFASSATAAYIDFIYTATSGQTTFTGADGNGNTLAYTTSNLDVFLNGVLLDDSDYTASNGTSIVLSSAAAASDILTAKAWQVNNVSSFDVNGAEFVLDLDGDTSITADTDDQIDFKTGGSDRMTIDSSGNVGIGTSSPQSELHISGASTPEIRLTDTTNTVEANFFTNDTVGTIGCKSNHAFVFNTNNTERMRIASTGEVTVTHTVSSGGLDVVCTDAGTNGSELELYHNSSSPADNDNVGFLSSRGNNSAAEKITMSQIRTTAVDITDGTEDSRISIFTMKAGTLTEQLRVEEDGDLHADGNVIAYSTTVSDVALKSDIEVIPNALDKLDEIRGVTFTRHNGKQSAGIIAQELEKVLPEAINETELPLQKNDGKKYKTVEYDAIHGLLIQAIKELKDELRELKS
jgi:hypothetical protein